MYSAPLFPVLELPVLRSSKPLTPVVPAFAVRISRDPLEEADPDPVTIEINPPEAADEAPAWRMISPPILELPDPTEIYTEPPRPSVLEVPDPIYRDPLSPTEEYPVLRIIFPETPLDPPGAV
jgi:hypothetical protein